MITSREKTKKEEPIAQKITESKKLEKTIKTI
jgi:hypothetical protein